MLVSWQIKQLQLCRLLIPIRPEYKAPICQSGGARGLVLGGLTEVYACQKNAVLVMPTLAEPSPNTKATKTDL